ncbi:class I adenylate-forming enzyme family protein [Effusibacillus dendaii]|uniref:AMP-binding protein n=1 Tax=Effusibacillus dendaii TaxID=2743772 RepID=A0A7I8DGE0_9BACL|nr:class I adenylate-forming enzyme family protein [Effusibacillus dendaii]BCJ88412.1 AMP-binding protein [Effusibacillus dendaii]
MIASAEERRKWLESEFPVWPRRTIASHFAHQSEKYAKHPLLLLPERQYTYEEIWRQARAIAKSLLAAGVERRDHIAVLMANEAEFVALMIAIWLVGAVCVPLNTMLRQDELAYLLRQSDSRYLIMHQTAGGMDHNRSVSRVYDQLLTEQGNKLKKVVCIPNGSSAIDDRFELWDTFYSSGLRITDQALVERWRASEYPDELAFIIYTSGSTGLPKGVMLSHDNFLRCAYSTCLSRAIEQGRRIFTPLPLYHVFAIEEGILAVSFVGGSVVTSREFSPLQSLQLMEKYQVNDFLCVPSMLVALVSHPEAASFRLDSLYALMCAAAPAPVPIWQRAIDVFGLKEICTGYGGTEATASTTHTEVGDPIERVVTRVGRIKPGGVTGLPEFGGANVQYKVIDPYTGENLPYGSVGELTVRGNTVTRGYYNKPEETTLTIDKDGWLRTGDLGRFDEDGYIELLGRSKELYRVSGENVTPKEVEEVISKHPKVNQVYVVGVPDKLTTETGAAFIELRPGETCTRREIINWCQDKLARFKVPRHVWFVSPSDWPITGNGKIQKFRLQEMAAQKLGGA